MSAPAPDVVVTEDVWDEPLQKLATELAIDRRPDAWRTPELLPEILTGARAVVVRNRTRVTADLLAACPDLQVVARGGVGLDNIDVDAANELGVVVVAPLGANAISVAEHTIGLALALARQTVPLDRASRAGQWDRRAGRELSGRTWGLLGAGATGRACARAAAALGMRVVAYDPYVAPDHPEVSKLGIRLVGLAELAAEADVLSCHLPATPETIGLIDAAFLGAMRPDALLISVGRGEVVDEEALADALAAGRLGGAGLDVRATEPPARGRLEEFDNVILTPHIAGITVESQRRIIGILAAEIGTILGGGLARYAVGSHNRPGRS
ncbi:hypothetical protein ONA70_11360 [Micromonospora yasonensis]|uniref:NAD(P)-dependent oxidoreductase n=1 Tax=Micromonospora yasonensis TaxID=1128667 RepID=UPI00222F9A8A|nr:NAD(P)-dependent oxidoreductase [Micromonospora yasonensis]MCW3840697.1 hypothetical protein [Micromonospora yasonensis]